MPEVWSWMCFCLCFNGFAQTHHHAMARKASRVVGLYGNERHSRRLSGSLTPLSKESTFSDIRDPYYHLRHILQLKSNMASSKWRANPNQLQSTGCHKRNAGLPGLLRPSQPPQFLASQALGRWPPLVERRRSVVPESGGRQTSSCRVAAQVAP